MRIIRFIDTDGRIHHGRDDGNGVATELLDPQGVLGPSSTAPQRAMFHDRHALVADDDERMRELMATVLRRVGCKCTVCADGRDAINVIEQESIDLVVSDIVMPHHNGYDIFTAAKKRHHDIPIVLVTGFGYDPTHSLVRASEEGLAAVLYKPFTPQQLLDELDRAIRVATPRPIDALIAGESIPVDKLLAPLDPCEIVCVGRNYRAAAAGAAGGGAGTGDGPTDEPSSIDELEVFLKPSTSRVGPGEAIRIPKCGGIDPLLAAEGELAVVIGATIREQAEEDVPGFILGYTAANDVTARHWQTKGGPSAWMRGKGFDTFCPLGPAIVTPDELGGAEDLLIRTVVNGEVIRSGSTKEMMRSVACLISELSRHVTLKPGTVVLTGAPPLLPPDRQCEPLAAGDEVVIDIEGIGRLENPVESA